MSIRFTSAAYGASALAALRAAVAELKRDDPLRAGTIIGPNNLAGIVAHERVHGEIIKETVRAIRSATEGLSVPGDPACRRIRADVTDRVAALAAEMRKRNRDFDQVEMGRDGNVQRLILALINGDRE